MNQSSPGNAVASQYRELEMKSPDARHMQRDLGNQTANPDFMTAATPRATDRSTATAAQLERIVQALLAGPKTTDALRALGVYQVSARIHALRARGYSIKLSFSTAMRLMATRMPAWPATPWRVWPPIVP